jgi:hypothetical protein
MGASDVVEGEAPKPACNGPVSPPALAREIACALARLDHPAVHALNHTEHPPDHHRADALVGADSVRMHFAGVPKPKLIIQPGTSPTARSSPKSSSPHRKNTQ